MSNERIRRMGTHYQGTHREVAALDLFIKLMRAADSLTARLAPGLARHGLTTSQLGVLEALHHLGPLCQRELGEKILKSNSNVTTVVDNLERRRLVRRTRGAVDRRFVEVRLTAAGARLVVQALPEHVGRIVKAVGALSTEEQQLLAGLCKRFGRAAAAAAAAERESLALEAEPDAP